MSIWSIADLHLSFGSDKPMEVFGEKWREHPHRIKEAWESRVDPGDLVVIPGDISWAMSLSQASPDLEWIGALPGTKLIVRGNHDYWWSAISKVRKALPPGVYALQNDHFTWEGWAVCGTRGWTCPGDGRFDPERDEKIYAREKIRLELSLQSAYKKGCANILAALHFPPFNSYREPSAFTGLLEAFGVKICLYGHLHGEFLPMAYEGSLGGVEYRFVAADGLDFKPALIVDRTP